jgi:hypothetical protein
MTSLSNPAASVDAPTRVSLRWLRPRRRVTELQRWAKSMRSVILFVALGTFTAGASEIGVTDEKRTELSAAVFTGTVTKVEHLLLIKTNSAGLGPRHQDLGWWRAEVVVDSVTKQDRALGETAVVYYRQQPIGGRAAFATSTAGYPKVEAKTRATFWCLRLTIEGHTNVLCVPSPSWVKSQ